MIGGLFGGDDTDFDAAEDAYDTDQDFIEGASASSTLKAPRETLFCIGHEQVEKSLLDLFTSGRIPHALIFSGPEGIGKATIAYRFARFLLAQAPQDTAQDSLFGAPEPPPPPQSLDIELDNPVVSRVASSGHSDLLTIERLTDGESGKRKGTVEADEIRRIAPFFRLTASAEGGWRIVIVDDADTMNKTSQNSILKILEEPPPRALIILVVHRIGALLPTIRSRARVVRFTPLAEDALADILGRGGHVLSAQEKSTLQLICAGSAGAAIRFMENDGLTIAQSFFDILATGPEMDRNKIHQFADAIAANKNGSDAGSEIAALVMCVLFRKLAYFKAVSAEIATGFGVHNKSIQAMLDRMSLEKILEAGARLEDHFQMMRNGNLDRRLSIVTAFQMM